MKSPRVDEQLLVPLVFQKRLRQCVSRFQVIIHQFRVHYFDFESSTRQSMRDNMKKILLIFLRRAIVRSNGLELNTPHFPRS